MVYSKGNTAVIPGSENGHIGNLLEATVQLKRPILQTVVSISTGVRDQVVPTPDIPSNVKRSNTSVIFEALFEAEMYTDVG